jgi:tyrosyl-tRNA synthetase
VLHPMDAKMQLAHVVIAGFHGEDAAKKASDEFRRVFRERQAPSEVAEYRIRLLPSGNIIVSKKHKDVASSVTLSSAELSNPVRWTKLVVSLGVLDSNSEAERLLKQGGFELDGQRVEDVKREIDLSKPGRFLLRAGKKKFLRIVVE